MYHIVETSKSVEQAAADLATAVAAHGFGVLHVHDLGGTLRSKGVEFGHECKVFEVCNPRQAGRVLANDLRLNMALPCRVSVYTEAGKTWIGMIRPTPMLGMLSDDPALAAIAREVEQTLVDVIAEAA